MSNLQVFYTWRTGPELTAPGIYLRWDSNNNCDIMEVAMDARNNLRFVLSRGEESVLGACVHTCGTSWQFLGPIERPEPR